MLFVVFCGGFVLRDVTLCVTRFKGLGVMTVFCYDFKCSPYVL